MSQGVLRVQCMCGRVNKTEKYFKKTVTVISIWGEKALGVEGPPLYEHYVWAL